MPLWPARIVLAAGTALLILQLLLDLAADLGRLARGGAALSVDDIIERDISGLGSLPAAPEAADTFEGGERR